MPDDRLLRATLLNGHARALACTSTELVNELQRRHQTWPVATAALGRTATIAAMMGTLMKNEERLTVRIKGDGPLGEIVVDADADGHVRGYVDNPHIHLPPNEHGKLDVGGAVGNGLLYIVRDSGLKDYYTGSSELQSGEIAEDFTYYFAVSEQTPSLVAAGVLVDVDNSVICAGGLIVQLMPEHTDADIAYLEEAIRANPSVTDLLKVGMDATSFLHHVLPTATVVEERPISFVCTCSHERIERALFSLGESELTAMLDEQGEAEVVCHFCATRHYFSNSELAQLIARRREHDQHSGDVGESQR